MHPIAIEQEVEEKGSALGEGAGALGARFGGDLASALVRSLLHALCCGGDAGAPVPCRSLTFRCAAH